MGRTGGGLGTLAGGAGRSVRAPVPSVEGFESNPSFWCVVGYPRTTGTVLHGDGTVHHGDRQLGRRPWRVGFPVGTGDRALRGDLTCWRGVLWELACSTGTGDLEGVT